MPAKSEEVVFESDVDVFMSFLHSGTANGSVIVRNKSKNSLPDSCNVQLKWRQDISMVAIDPIGRHDYIRLWRSPSAHSLVVGLASHRSWYLVNEDEAGQYHMLRKSIPKRLTKTLSHMRLFRLIDRNLGCGNVRRDDATIVVLLVVHNSQIVHLNNVVSIEILDRDLEGFYFSAVLRSVGILFRFVHRVQYHFDSVFFMADFFGTVACIAKRE
jgi:hypothetical protein